MQQSLNFYEVILSHNHPVLVGILRLASQSARSRNDKVRLPLVHSCGPLIECDQVLVWVSAVTVTFLACQLCTGVWSTNLYAPHYGDRDLVGRGYSILPDGSVAPKYIFGGVISGVVIVVAALWTFMWCESFHKIEEDVLNCAFSPLPTSESQNQHSAPKHVKIT